MLLQRTFLFIKQTRQDSFFPRAVTGKMREIPANMLKQLHRRLMAQKKERQRERKKRKTERGCMAKVASTTRRKKKSDLKGVEE